MRQLAQRTADEGVDLAGPGGLLQQPTKQVLETGLEVEMSEHLGYDKHETTGRNGENSRNGTRAKTVTTEVGPVELEVPRDREGSFKPKTVRKRQRRLHEALTRPVAVSTRPEPIEIGVSLGTTALDAATAHLDAALARADAAMYQAKRPAARSGAGAPRQCRSRRRLLVRTHLVSVDRTGEGAQRGGFRTSGSAGILVARAAVRTAATARAGPVRLRPFPGERVRPRPPACPLRCARRGRRARHAEG